MISVPCVTPFVLLCKVENKHFYALFGLIDPVLFAPAIVDSRGRLMYGTSLENPLAST